MGFLKASFLYGPRHLSVREEDMCRCFQGWFRPHSLALCGLAPIPAASETFHCSLSQWVCCSHASLLTSPKYSMSVQTPPAVARIVLLFCRFFRALCMIKSQFKFLLHATLMPLLSEPKILCPRHLRWTHYVGFCTAVMSPVLPSPQAIPGIFSFTPQHLAHP